MKEIPSFFVFEVIGFNENGAICFSREGVT